MSAKLAESLLIPVPEAARLLGIGQTLAWDMARRGTLPTVRLGRSVRVPRAYIDATISEALQAAQAKVEGALR
jgi:excisionase family DNA binding protein